MLKFESFVLDNGLQVVVHEDPTSLVASVNIMYNVGARDESPDHTGFAHLFEHLMFGGSKNIPSYDSAIHQAGGSSNAYTSQDVTSYHCTLPSANIEAAFWLESDRMSNLAFKKELLDIQKKVVVEEFKEVYLNQPYGDAWLNLTKLAYTTHPYQWPVIGKEISHIEQITMQQVKSFYKKFYVPNNAVLAIAGGIKLAQIKSLSQKWFAPIAPGRIPSKNFPQEPVQQAPRTHTIKQKVPLDAIYKAYHIPGRLTREYYVVELLCNALGIGKSSRLYQKLIEDQAYFSTIGAYTTETIDPGLLVITGKVNENISLEEAEAALEAVLLSIQEKGFTAAELEKAKNQIEAQLYYNSVEVAHRAEELALATLLGDTHLVNNITQIIASVTLDELNSISKHVLQKKNSSTLYYKRS